MLATKQNKQRLIEKNGVEFYEFDGLEFVQQEMLRLLKIIDRVAREKKIDYWIDAGSLIGVVRHNGFIPWDDDLDISMLKKDYNRLIAALKDYSLGHEDVFLYFDPPQSYHSCNFFASTKIFTRSEKSAVLIPVKVDLRPLNVIAADEKSLLQNNLLRDKANLLIYGKSYGYCQDRHLDSKHAAEFFKFYNNEYGFEDESNPKTSLVHPYFEFSTQFNLTISDIYPLVRHEFYDVTVPIPCNTDYILKKLYGDYMKLPDLENRAPVACEYVVINPSKKSIKRYINKLFGYNDRKLFTKLSNLIEIMRFVGVKTFLRSKLYE